MNYDNPRAKTTLDQIDRLRSISADLEVRLRQLEQDVRQWFVEDGLAKK